MEAFGRPRCGWEEHTLKKQGTRALTGPILLRIRIIVGLL
jgi:hypothetical protein